MVYYAKWKMVLVGLVGMMGVLFAFPNLISEEDATSMPYWLPNQQMNLGLDLVRIFYLKWMWHRFFCSGAKLWWTPFGMGCAGGLPALAIGG